MKRRHKVAILASLLAPALGAWALLRPTGDPVVAKARTLRRAMTVAEANSVLDLRRVLFEASTSSGRKTTCYPFECGNRDLRALVSSDFPFIHPRYYWHSRSGRVTLVFRSDRNGNDWAEPRLEHVSFRPRDDADEVELLPKDTD